MKPVAIRSARATRDPRAFGEPLTVSSAAASPRRAARVGVRQRRRDRGLPRRWNGAPGRAGRGVLGQLAIKPIPLWPAFHEGIGFIDAPHDKTVINGLMANYDAD
jgi:hypothetical protein